MRKVKGLVAAVVAACVGFSALIVPSASATTSVLGDVNSDGNINTTDVSIINSFLSGSCRLSSPNLADVNCDGVINRRDRVNLSAYIANTATISTSPMSFTALRFFFNNDYIGNTTNY